MRCIALWVCAFASVASPQAPTVAFEPAGPVLSGDPIRIVGTSVPGTGVALELTMVGSYGRTWRSVSHYTVPEDGVVDVAKIAPSDGSAYSGVDALGPFWSLRLDRSVEAVTAPRDGRAEELVVTLRDADGGSASAKLLCWIRGPGVEWHGVEDASIVGELALPAGAGPHPGVVVVGDANGGLRGQRRFAELLASRGYAVLALAYFGMEGLPDELQSIPLEYFDRAIDGFVRRTEVDGDRLAVLGSSKGGELALLLGSRDPRLRAVVAYTPSSVVFQGIPSRPKVSSWTWDGAPVPYVEYSADERFRESRLLVDLYAASLDAASEEVMQRAEIPVEKIRGPVLLVSGQRDNLWPASRMTHAVRDRLRRNGHPFEVELLDFADAGHEVGGPGYGPARVARSMGGTPRGKAHALAASWTATLEFLARHLKRDRIPADFSARLDAFVRPLLEDRVLSGVLRIARGETVLLDRVWAMADYEHAVANRIDTRFCIASITKPITALLLEHAIRAGEVATTDPVSKWIPDFPRGDEITVAMLRDHRSGIPHRVTEAADETRPHTAETVVELAKRASLKFEPGADESYSSAGYTVLARVLELAAGKPFGVLLEERVCAPAGLRHTRHCDHRHVLPRRARSYFPGVGGPENAPLEDTSFLVGAGSIWSTVEDLHRLCVALQSGAIRSAAFEAERASGAARSWRGSTNGYASFVDWIPEKDVVVVFCGNLASGREPLRAGVASLLRGEAPAAAPRLPKPARVDRSVLRGFEGTYRVGDRFELDVRLFGDVLRCGDRAMIPTEGGAFYYPERDAIVRFERGNSGRVTGMRWTEHGDTWTLPRVPR